MIHTRASVLIQFSEQNRNDSDSFATLCFCSKIFCEMQLFICWHTLPALVNLSAVSRESHTLLISPSVRLREGKTKCWLCFILCGPSSAITRLYKHTAVSSGWQNKCFWCLLWKSGEVFVFCYQKIHVYCWVIQNTVKLCRVLRFMHDK